MTRHSGDGRAARSAEIIARTRFTDHFLAPVRAARGICAVCAGPLADGGALCSACAAHRRQAQELGAETADRAVFVAYSVAGSQSDWDMHRYKAASPGPANPSWMRTAGLAAHFGVMHRACLDAGRFGPVDAFAVVPSLGGRPTPHPLETLAAYLLPRLPAVALSAAAGDRGDSDQRRVFQHDFFAVSDHEAVCGRHIVLVDDTWVTGSHLQSAAAALRQAGAVRVTGLILARRLRPDWGTNADFISERLVRPYDVAVCPVGGHIG
ncbi:hypothetical protein AB0I22_01570 [Streptomyces sp. NPDC050610]|uniref:hypothetical protein n=1 Tax=Streptomyces sp. NPDC050610 TaxID=3157097 RepID=UPI0034217AB8